LGELVGEGERLMVGEGERLMVIVCVVVVLLVGAGVIAVVDFVGVADAWVMFACSGVWVGVGEAYAASEDEMRRMLSPVRKSGAWDFAERSLCMCGSPVGVVYEGTLFCFYYTCL
jgi:hypothetical protein